MGFGKIKPIHTPSSRRRNAVSITIGGIIFILIGIVIGIKEASLSPLFISAFGIILLIFGLVGMKLNPKTTFGERVKDTIREEASQILVKKTIPRSN